jgi:DNA mismatch repair protein MutS
MQSFNTPMMKQYMEIKKRHVDCLLFYRMGDFYELFMEDAYIGAKVLNITLTGRPKGKDGRIPMAGVPFHAVDTYLAKLVKAGYKVAICEQLSPPSKKGIIERDVIRIVTPGTMLDEKALEKKENNFLISLFYDKSMLALSTVDISTGYFTTAQFLYDENKQVLKDEISRLHPTECILPQELYDDPELLKILRSEKGLNIFCFQNWHNYAVNARDVLKKHFGVVTLASFGIDSYDLAIESSAALLGYLKETQKDNLSHLKKICFQTSQDAVILDRSTIINLELFSTIREHDTKGSLLSVLDHTSTPMGGRLLKQWLRSPLTNREEIIARHESVEELVKKVKEREILKELFVQIPDIERTLSRLSVKIGNARDVTNLKQALETVLLVKETVTTLVSYLLKENETAISPQISDIITTISERIVDEPPIDLRNGGIIRAGVNKELDTLRNHVSHSHDWVLELEKKERERTGISSLKVRFNKVFGFYIEISKSNLTHVPDNYMRKQTLVNGERFITPELKEHEEIILTAEEKINELEYALFGETLKQVLSYTEMIQRAAGSIAIIDCLLNFATIAEKNNYTRPTLLYSGEIKIVNGRHPVVEKLLEQDKQFVPNTVDLDNTNHQLMLLTGPNMAGKSVYIRQVALILLLSQIGSFIPAESAQLSIVDRIFVRSGASDLITS